MSEFDYDVYEVVVTRDSEKIVVTFPCESPSPERLYIQNPGRVHAAHHSNCIIVVVDDADPHTGLAVKKYWIRAKRAVFKVREE